MLKINGIEFNENEYSYSNNEDGKQVEIEHTVYGQRNNLLIQQAFSGKEIAVEVDGDKFTGAISSSSSSFTGDLDEETKVTLRYTIVEYKEASIGQQDQLLVDLMFLGMKNWARTRAISELLIEKEVITAEQYEVKIDEVFKRDNEEFLKTFSVLKK